MAAYVIFIKERTHNQGELDLYAKMAAAALAGHPITFRIAHGQKEVVEGPDFEDMMMLEFPTFWEARAWYESPAYRAASEHRFKGADYRAIIVEGVPREATGLLVRTRSSQQGAGGPRNNEMNEIFWPENYIPGFTDNFVSNEVIVAGLSAVDVWPLLSKASLWPTYYSNSANIRFYDGKGPELDDGARFYFETFGFPVEAQVLEYVPPAEGKPGRCGWHGWGGEGDTRFDVYHAWLLEDLPGGRVRILTQESQRGKPAQELAKKKPNVMINGHQDWLDGLVVAARKARSL
jgi:uncharacterized protein (DUF1330 family)